MSHICCMMRSNIKGYYNNPLEINSICDICRHNKEFNKILLDSLWNCCSPDKLEYLYKLNISISDDFIKCCIINKADDTIYNIIKQGYSIPTLVDTLLYLENDYNMHFIMKGQIIDEGGWHIPECIKKYNIYGYNIYYRELEEYFIKDIARVVATYL